jgi:hypothetical protein
MVAGAPSRSLIIKANQPSLLEAVTNAFAGTDADFMGTSWTEEAKGYGVHEKRSIRIAPPQAPAGRTPPRPCACDASVMVQVRMGCGLPLPIALGHAMRERAVQTQQQSSGSIDARSPRRCRA